MKPARTLAPFFSDSPRKPGTAKSPRAFALAALIVTMLITCFSAADATILVYDGTVKDYDVTYSSSKMAQHCFLVTDQVAQQVVLIYYFRAPGGKKTLVLGDITSVNAIVFPRPDGKQVSTFSTSVYQDLGGGGFVDHSLFLSGIESFLNTNTANGMFIKTGGARTLTGIYRLAAAAFVGRYDEQSITATFDQKRTVEANAGQKTLQQTMDDLVAYLKSIGYSI